MSQSVSPPGYRAAYTLRLTGSSGLVLALNLGALVLLVPAIALFVWPAIVRGFLADDLVFTLTLSLTDGLMLLTGTLGVVLAHEGVHGLVMRAFGAHPRFGIKWELMAAYAVATGHFFSRNQFLVVALAPLAILTPVLWLGTWWAPPGALWMALALAGILNSVGAVGDLFMARQAARHPTTALVLDEEDGMTVFVLAPGDILRDSGLPQADGR